MSLISSPIPSSAGAQSAKTNDAKNSGASDLGRSQAPRHQVAETDDAYGLTVELPGVHKDDLELSIDHEQIHVIGRRAWRRPETWTALHRETRDATFELVLEHGRVIAGGKVHAERRDGILQVSLPKAGAVKPRKITVA